MRNPVSGMQTTVGGVFVTLLAGTSVVSAHSWVERVYKVAPNGTMIGAEGYPRGWLPRNSTDPLWKDAIPQWILPPNGQSAYSGKEIINKYQKEENPQYPMLEAAPGDHIALLHLENGHTTLPQNQPKKPKNRGTIYFYGTSQPKDQEKLFDVHLLWNRNGTGGDGRGKLLATRNYDDGQCYQPNNGPISIDRAAALAVDGADHNEELPCQSDLQLPEDLKAGSIYTIYWYWDWPDLNADAMDVNATTNGIFPWAGTFMRGEKDPHGFTMAAISKNESYASTVDVKIVSASTPGFSAKGMHNEWVSKQNIYSKAIEEQMQSNYQVDIDANGGGSVAAPSNSSMPATTAVQPSEAVTTTPAQVTAPATVTVTMTVQPWTYWKTIYKTVPIDQIPSATDIPEYSTQPASTVVLTVTQHVPAVPTPESETSTVVETITQHVPAAPSQESETSTVMLTLTTHVPAVPQESPTSTVMLTLTTHVPADSAPTSDAVTTTSTTTSFIAPTGLPKVTPFKPLNRRNWGFGKH